MITVALMLLGFGVVVGWSAWLIQRRARPSARMLEGPEGGPPNTALPVVVRELPLQPRENGMQAINRVGATFIGSFCLVFGLLAVTAILLGARHPAIYVAAIMLLMGAVDFLMAAMNVKGHKPWLLWFFP